MAVRGPYAKGVAKRQQILDTALELVARVGYNQTTVRELARAVDLSTAGLLHYFGTREDLFICVLQRRDEVTARAVLAHPRTAGAQGRVAEALRDALLRLVRHNVEVPGLVTLYVRMVAAATDPQHGAHDYVRGRFALVRQDLEAILRLAEERGELPPQVDPVLMSGILVALLEGLQAQWAVDRDFDIAEHLLQALHWLGLIGADDPPSIATSRDE